MVMSPLPPGHTRPVKPVMEMRDADTSDELLIRLLLAGIVADAEGVDWVRRYGDLRAAEAVEGER